MYNFVENNVFLTDCNPNHFSIISENKLIIVYESIGFMKIYDLNTTSEEFKPIITIPLIESNVKQLIHSNFGNYLAIFGDNKKDINSKTVRVYCNYWIEGQPLRIRSFGSLARIRTDDNTSDYNIRESVSTEVIELNDPSVESEAQYISCCESSANLCICCGLRVKLYCFQTYEFNKNTIKTDFVFLLDIRLQWFATKVSIAEHYISVMSERHCSLLKIVFDYDNEQNGHNGHNGHQTHAIASIDSNILNDHQISQISDNKCIEWSFENSETIRLPSMFGIYNGQQVRDNNMSHSQQVLGPVDQSLSCKFSLNMNHSYIESRICRASIEVLLCQYFLTEDPIIDIELMPFFKSSHSSSDPLNASKLNSFETNSTKNINEYIFQSSSDMIGSALIVLTNSHFYCYNIFNKIELMQKIEFIDKINRFSISRNDDTLHFLTDKGLETYSFNFLPIFVNYKKSVPVSKLNFKTFLNIEYLLNTNNYLVLITGTENQKKTIYSLKKPSLGELSYDINEMLNNSNIKLEDQFNTMSYLNAILHFNCSLNPETDRQIINIYHKSCVNLCNLIIDAKHSNFEALNALKFSLDLIYSANLTFAHLITLDLNYNLIYGFIRNKLELNQTFNIHECELNSLKSFLIAFYKEDYILFCCFALNQLLEPDVRQIVIHLLQESTDRQLCKITLSKLLLDNNEMNAANNLLVSLEIISTKAILCKNYKFILKHNCFVQFLEKCIPNIFYSFLLLLVNHNKSVQLIYKMLDNYELSVRHNFLINAYEQYFCLFDSQLIFEIISIYIQFLCNENSYLSYKPIKSIDKKMVFWIEFLPPIHTSEKECFCVKCNKITYELYTILYSFMKEDIVKNEINNLLNTIDSSYVWLFTARLLAMSSIEAIELLLNDFPHIVFPYVSDICSSDSNVMKQVLSLLESKVDNISQLDANSHIGCLLSYTLNQLALSLSPEDFISILPQSWKEFAMAYVEKSIIHFQSKKLKEKIINLGLEVKTVLS